MQSIINYLTNKMLADIFRASRDARRQARRFQVPRHHPLVLSRQTLITGNKLENRDCHNPGTRVESHQSGALQTLTSCSAARGFDSTAISRYINADGEAPRRHERARRDRAGLYTWN